MYFRTSNIYPRTPYPMNTDINNANIGEYCSLAPDVKIGLEITTLFDGKPALYLFFKLDVKPKKFAIETNHFLSNEKC